TVTSCDTIRSGCYRVSGFATLGTQHRPDAKSQRGRCAPLVRSCSSGIRLVARRAHASDRNATTSSRGKSDHQFRGRITCAAVGSRTSDTEGSVHLRLPHDGRRRPGARPRAGPAQSRPKIPGGTWRRLRVRRQAIPLEVSGEEFFLDLLFYHLRLRCFMVVDLKMEAFKSEFAGKMNFYLSAVDDQLRHNDDQPSIGLLLCKERDRLIVEYALRDVKKPIGVAEWRTRLDE